MHLTGMDNPVDGRAICSKKSIPFLDTEAQNPPCWIHPPMQTLRFPSQVA